MDETFEDFKAHVDRMVERGELGFYLDEKGEKIFFLTKKGFALATSQRDDE